MTTRVADPDGVDPDPDPTNEKPDQDPSDKTDPDPT